MRAYTHRFVRFASQCFIILLLTFGLSFSAGHSLAQDVATDTPTPSDTATVAPTDVPTDVPTVVPTDLPTTAPTDTPTDVPTSTPTDVPTSSATDAVTEQPTSAGKDATATDVPTQNPTQPPATSVSSDVFKQDFQDGQTSAWLLTPGWLVTDEAGNKILAATTPNEMATLTGVAWPYFTLSFRVRGDIQLNVASGGSGYQIKIASDGAASLYKDGALLGQSAGTPATDATIEPDGNWHTVNLLAPGNLLAVKVDNLTPVSTSDATLVGMGPLMFGTATDNSTSAAFDDLNIQRLDAPPPIPTAIPTSGVATIPPPPTETAEPTTEATAEPTIEATSEATSEATVEATLEATAEATSEATAEATIEATTEATAEATVEPLLLSDDAQMKLPPALLDILKSYESGDVDAAKAAAADYFIPTDDQHRISVTIWTKDEHAAAQIAKDITTANGLVTNASGVHLQASVTLEGLVALANAPEVTLIDVQPRAVSTSDMQIAAPGGGIGTGTEISEGVDTTGAAAWQNAGIKGSGVNIAVIDTGFGTAATVAANTENACLGNYTVQNQTPAAGDSTHGLSMVQVLCDMAPQARVFMYKATNYLNLQNAIANAATTNKVIVIAMDLGASIGPGDGINNGPNDGASLAGGVYTAITNARNNGKIVIVSAGNNTGRYVTLNYTGSAATIPMSVYAGDTIHVSWNDWSTAGTTFHPSTLAPTAGGAHGFSQNVTTNTTSNRTAPSPAGYSYPVSSAQCPINVSCDVTLTVSGTASGIIQVQITGTGTLDSSSVGGTGVTVNDNAGNIARPADSQDAIAVGAVCPDGSGYSLILDSFSSHGPVFTSGGGVPTPLLSYTRDQVKPDLTGPTHVSVVGAVTDNGQGGCDASGFNGTSAAAAHIAGMAALLVSNTNTSMSVFDGTGPGAVNALQDYLQTHTIDNTAIPSQGSVGYHGVGYDMSYGAGYSLLGNPNYDLSQITAITNPANQLPAACSAAVYVGLNNPGSSQDGTLTNPYIDINEALAKATATDCVVVLPGEYVSPINVSDIPLTHGTHAILSYQSAVSVTVAPTNLWSVISSPVIILSSTDVVVDGFTAQSAFTITYTADGTTNRTPAFRIARTSVGTILQNMSFTGYRSPGVIVSSSNIQVINTTFNGFVIPKEVAAVFTKPANHSAALEITQSTGVVLSNNTFQSNTIPSIGSTGQDIFPWEPSVVGISYSGVDIFNNRFMQNTSASILGINQWANPSLPDASGSSALQTEIRVVGNVFGDNTVNGPLLHLVQAPKLRFVNNTVANNLMKSDPADSRYNGYFVYGVDIVDDAHTPQDAYAQLSNRRIEIHNNVFNSTSTLPLSFLANARPAVNIGCDSIQGGAPFPVRNNWFFPDFGPSFLPAECNNKISGSITDTITPATYFGTDADPIDPYRLRPNAVVTAITGINTGDDSALTTMTGFSDLSTIKDLIGADRRFIGRNDNPTYSNANHVDIGAYELGLATPPVAQNIVQTITEDSATSVVFHLIATGGYSRKFTITSSPTNYDTKKTNACGGQPVAFSPPNKVTYCPPPNFHTLYGSGSTDMPIVIGFSVVDNVGNPGLPDNKSITLTISPQDDGAPTPLNINKITDYGTPIDYQLGPAPTFNNFNLVGAANGVDYPVTFAYAGHDAGGIGTQNLNLLDTGGQSTDTILTAAFNQANLNGGHLIINPVGGQKGLYRFKYTITEVNGGQSTQGNGSIIVVPTVAQDGHYDDDSFYIAYNGTGWIPNYSISTAYNHTLHASRIINDQLEFPFTGTVASLNMVATNLPTTASIKVEFNLDVGSSGNSYVTYAAAQGLIPGLTCVSTLNNLAPNSVTSNILNYSLSSLPYKLICRGFPVGSVQSMRLTNNVANSAMTIDSMDVGSGTFKPGLYQDNDINVSYFGAGWIKQAIATASGGARSYSVGAANYYNFQVKNAARFVLFTSPGPTGGTMQVCITPEGGVATCSNRSDNHAGTVLYQQQQAFNGLDSTVVYTVEVRNVSTVVTQYIDLDAVQVFAPTAALTPALYQQDNINITYNGSGWIKQAAPLASAGSRTYATGAANNYSFQVTGATRFTLYVSTGITGGVMQVCITPTPSGVTGACSNRSENSSVALWQQKQAFGGLDTTVLYTVTVANISTVATQYIDLDAIEVFGVPAPLTASLTLYQQENPNITYTGAGWKLAVNALTNGGSNRYSSTVGDSYKFQISNAGRFVLYTTPSSTGGTMQVCIAPIPVGQIQSCSTRTNFNNNPVPVYQQQQVFTGLDPLVIYTITVTNLSSPPTPPKVIDLDAIAVLADVVPLVPTLPVATPGLYQQDNTNILYNGFGWKTIASTLASGSSYRSSAVQGNSYTFKFQGADRFVLYNTLGSTGGNMQVCITQLPSSPILPCSTISEFASPPAILYQQQRYFTVPDSTKTYSVTVTNTVAGKYTDLDAIEIDAPLAPLSMGLHQQNDPGIRYVGSAWRTISNINASSGNFRSTLGLNNSYSFQVTGATRFALYTSPGITGGTMQVCIVPTPTGGTACPAAINNRSDYAAVALWQQQQIFTGLLSGTLYTVTVTNIVANKYIDLDAVELLPDAVPLTPTPGFYQQDNANITYTGAGWKTAANVLASAGNLKNTLGIGNSYTFQVTGADRLTLLNSSGPTGGTMTVCITPTPTGVGGLACGDPLLNISQYSVTPLYQQPHYFTGLVSGTTYTVTVTNSSNVATKFIDLDAIRLDAPLQPLLASTTIYQQDNANIRYTGAAWKTVGTYKSTTGIGNKYEFQVQNADRFVLYVSPNITGGTMQVCINPVPAGYAALCSDVTNNRTDYAAAAQTMQPRFFSGLVPATLYTVTVTNVSPAPVPPAAAKFIDIDAIEVLAPAQPLGPGLYQESDQNITYTGNAWVRAASPLASGVGGNFRSTTGLGNKYEFDVTGADRFTLLTTTGPTGGTMNVCIVPTPAGMNPTCSDPSNNFSLLTAATLYQQPRYFTGLDSGTPYHVTVTNNVAAKFTALDAIKIDAPLLPLLPSTTFYQQDDANVRYTGAAWKTVGTYKSTTAIGNKYEFQVKNADRFVLYVNPNTTGGTMQVCINPVPVGYAALCADVTNNRSDYAAVAQTVQPRIFNGLVPATLYTVTVTNVSPAAVPPALPKFIDIDAIEVQAPAQPLGPGLYQENDQNINYTGKGWTRIASTLASGPGGNFRRTIAATDTISFTIATGATRFALLTSPGLTGGKMNVCITDVTTSTALSCISRSDNSPIARYQQAQIFTLPVPAHSYSVTVSNISTLPTQYIDLDAIQIVNTPAVLNAGWYQDTDLNLTYTGTWTQDTQAGITGGQTTFTTVGLATTPTNEMRFSFLGTGFSIFTYNPPTGATMEICYRLSSDPDDTTFNCATTATNATPAQGNVGYAVYGLKQNTYIVRVRRAGTSGTQALFIDRIAVLNTPPNVLTAGTYENNAVVAANPAIVFSPASLWPLQSNVNYSGGNAISSANKGATAQIRFVGTTLIIYQSVGPSNSRNVLLCRVLQGPLTNPAPQCGSFSQNTPIAAFKAPIAFYGFGTGTNEIVIENRVQGGALNIDKITVQ